MKAGVGSADGVVMADVDPPIPSDEQVLVKVNAAGLNRADLVTASSPVNRGLPIGMEWAGEVIAAGSAVSGLAVGDFVSCSGAGGYAEYAACDAGRAVRFDPGRLSIEQAAVLPLALLTAHNALFTAGGMKPGEAVLIHGASTGVGLAALRIARLMGAGVVAGTSTSAEKRKRLADLGVEPVIDSSADGWAQAVLAATDGKGADLVLDMIAGAGLNETMQATAILGRIVNVGRLGGVRAEIDLDLNALRRLSWIGVTFRTRTPAEVREIVRAMTHDLWSFVEAGDLSLPVDRAFPLSEAAAAHAYMASNKHFGKIALAVQG